MVLHGYRQPCKNAWQRQKVQTERLLILKAVWDFLKHNQKNI